MACKKKAAITISRGGGGCWAVKRIERNKSEDYAKYFAADKSYLK